MKLERTPSPAEMIHASKQHYTVYDNNKKPTTTHFIMLYYAVECIIKADFCKYHGKSSIKNEKYRKLLLSHKLDELISELKLPNINLHSCCPKAILKNGSKKHDIAVVHSLWRYGLELTDDTQHEIVKWLNKVIKMINNQGGY